MAAKEDPQALHRVPECVGPDEEDVSRHTDRQLVLRTLNEVLHMKVDVQATLKQGNLTGQRVTALEVYQRRWLEEHPATPPVGTTHPAPPPAHPPHDFEKEQSSYNDVVNLFGQAGAEAYRKMKDPKSKVDSDRIKTIAAQTFEAIENAEKADKLDRLEAAAADSRRQIRNGVIVAVLAGLLLGIGGIVWGSLRVSAAVEQGRLEERGRPAVLVAASASAVRASPPVPDMPAAASPVAPAAAPASQPRR